MVINPLECIDCGACVPACPVDAIVFDEDISKEQDVFLAINVQLSQKTPIIFASREPHPEAEKYREESNKRIFLDI